LVRLSGGGLMSFFTAVAAYIGLLTGMFTFWDRYAKGRPIAFLVFEAKEARLRISNPGDYSIFILSTKTIPEVFFLSRDASIRSILKGQFSGITYWPIEPKGIAEFVIRDLHTDGAARGLKDQRVRFSVSWRRGSVTWLWQLPVTVRTRTSTINKLRDAPIESAA
jgi:hypothetical protein